MTRDDLPVVLAHGWGGTYETTWHGTALEAGLRAAGRRLVAVDLPGHGKASSSHDPNDYADIADQLLAKFANEPQIDAVGFSLGGKLLLDLAVRFPGRIRRLVVAGVGTNLYRPENGELISRSILATDDSEVPLPLEQLVAGVHSSGNDPRSLAAVICRPPRLLTPAALQTISTEILLIAGSDDRMIGEADQLRGALPGSRLEWLDGVDHLSTPSSVAFQKLALHFLTTKA